MMHKLAGASRQVPESYLVDKFSGLKVEEAVIASGGFADIRKGIYKGMNVAVKTIRVSEQPDIKALHEVCKAARCPILDD